MSRFGVFFSMLFEKEETDKREKRKWRLISLTFITETGKSFQKLILIIIPACHFRKWFIQVN